MPTDRASGVDLVRALLAALCLTGSGLHGCGSSPEVTEISPRSKELLTKRKVDVMPRAQTAPGSAKVPAQASKTGRQR
jgi:hypothetical protein